MSAVLNLTHVHSPLIEKNMNVIIILWVYFVICCVFFQRTTPVGVGAASRMPSRPICAGGSVATHPSLLRHLR